MNILSFLLHLLLDFLLGKGILSLLKKEKLPFATFFIALLLGIFAETMLSFVLMWSGLSLQIVLVLNVVLALILNVKTAGHLLKNRSLITDKIKNIRTAFAKFAVFDWLLLLLIFQKIGFILWQLLRIPTFHSDALKHWSMQGRLIYSQFNFSLDTDSALFLGQQFKMVMEYPLSIPIWRANSAILNGGWDDFISRSDGLLFFLVICGIVDSVVWTLTQKRWMALGATFIIASLPLQVWHAAAGYADIGVEAFLVAAIACFIGKEFLLCGLLVAGAAWSKNDGMAMYFPAMMLAVLAFHFLKKEGKFSEKLKGSLSYIVGFTAVLPWVIFQALHINGSVLNKLFSSLGGLLKPIEKVANDYQEVAKEGGKNFADAPPSYELFWDYVFTGSTFGVFWILLVLALLLLSRRLLTDAIGRGLLVFFLSTAAIIFYVFTFTPAFEYLLIQTTVHRVLLQFSGAALLVVFYGGMLQMQKNKN